MKRIFIPKPTNGIVYMVAANDGSHFQPFIYGQYEKYEDAKNAIDTLIARRTSYTHLYIYKAEQILSLEQDWQ